MKILFFLFILPPSAFAISKAGKMQMKPLLQQDFSNLVGKASDFHKAFQKEDIKGIKNEIAETKKIIQKLYGQLPKISQVQQRIHSHKVLKSLEEQLEMMKFQDSFYKSQKNKHIKKLFSIFFELAHVYGFKNKVKNRVFYCHRDKSVWFQSERNPKNPVNPSYKNCGRQIW